MIYESTDKNIKDMLVTCNCGCQEGMEFRFVKEKYDDINNTDYFIELCTSEWGSEQDHGIRRLKFVIQKIWKIIRGKDFYYSEIMLTPEQWKEFKAKINEVP